MLTPVNEKELYASYLQSNYNAFVREIGLLRIHVTCAPSVLTH